MAFRLTTLAFLLTFPTTTLTTTTPNTTASLWLTLYEVGMPSESTFNSVFRSANSGIIRRQCTNCISVYQDVYIWVADPDNWNAYQELLVTWTATGFQTSFNIYSSLVDALAQQNAWTFCNGNDLNVGFARDCGPAGSVGGQWNSLVNSNGQQLYHFSVLSQAGGVDTWSSLFDSAGHRRSEADVNRDFRSAGTGIIRRECSGCASSHRDVYIWVAQPESWNAYQELLVTWTATGFQTSFNIYSSLADALDRQNGWAYCNGGHTNVGFPRDCGPTAAVGNQWNSIMGTSPQPQFRFSVYAPAAVRCSCQCFGVFSEQPLQGGASQETFAMARFALSFSLGMSYASVADANLAATCAQEAPCGQHLTPRATGTFKVNAQCAAERLVG